MIKRLLFFSLALGSVVSCSPQEKTTTNADTVSHIKEDTAIIMRKTLTNVLQENTHLWMEIPGVIGTAEGQDPNGQPAIVIFAEHSAADVQSKLPTEKDGYLIVVREIGTIQPLNVKVEVDTSVKPKKK